MQEVIVYGLMDEEGFFVVSSNDSISCLHYQFETEFGYRAFGAIKVFQMKAKVKLPDVDIVETTVS